MSVTIFKETHFDAAHRLMYYNGKCSRLHGHRWTVEVRVTGEIEEKSKILIDYNIIKQIIDVYDHQIILNKDDPLVKAVAPYQTPVLTDGDPSSELIAEDIRNRINTFCRENNLTAKVSFVRVWESAGSYAEVGEE